MGNAGGVMITVCLAVVGMVIAAFPVIRTINWWIEGSLDGIQASVVILLYVALLGGIMGAPSAIKFVLLLFILISALAAPFIGNIAAKAGNRQIDDESMSRYIRALEINPNDVGARLAVADSLAKRGDLEQAISHAQWVVQQHPRLEGTVGLRIKTWERQLEYEKSPHPVFCHMCHAELPASATVCPECGAKFGTKAAIIDRIATEGGLRVVVTGWLTTTTLLLVAIGLFLELPIEFAAPITAAAVIVGGFLFLRWVSGSLGVPGD